MAEESKSPVGDSVIEMLTVHRQRLAEATPEDLKLAELLMKAAFFGQDQPAGIGPLYLEQACHLNRELRLPLVDFIESNP